MKTHKILIVDDDYQNLQLLFAYLNEINPNFDIVKTNRSEKAYKIASNRSPDLVITDWEMPTMSGLDLIKKLKADPKTQDIPVIMLTGIMLTSDDLKIAFESGAVDFISKPATKNELSARVNSVLHLSDSYKEIKRLNDTKDKFFSIVAHDLAGPYNSLLATIQKLNDNIDEYSKDKIKQNIKILNDNAAQNFRLINNLLLWSQTQQGSIPFKPKKISLKNVFQEIETTFNPISANKRIALEIKPPEDHHVIADKSMLTIIMENLINNAFKYTKKGKVKVDTLILDEFVEFIISDTGIGINNDVMNRLFKLDVLSRTPGNNDEKGTGLGLILCKEFVEMNKGKIWVESKVKKGSHFHFTLPISQN